MKNPEEERERGVPGERADIDAKIGEMDEGAGAKMEERGGYCLASTLGK